MIGIISKKSQKSTIEEFFQLFKTPWEFYDREKQYDVILMTQDHSPLPKARLLILFSTMITHFDDNYQIRINSHIKKSMINLDDNTLPVHKAITFLDSEQNLIIKNEKNEMVGVRVSNAERKIIRIGYDLFDEIEHLITEGQRTEHAAIPTLDIHIELLKSWILDSGIQVIEIPPVPDQYSFTVCLTHDVDFINITDHGLDHSVIGYILRSIFPGSLKNYRSKIAWNKIIKNWKALLSLPFVYLGLIKDIWFDIDRYCEIEREVRSTYFFLPYKGNRGEASKKCQPYFRAMKYNIQEYIPLIQNIIYQGHEIGLHGIDAWKDDAQGRQEKEVIENITGKKQVGIRIHWLYFKKESPNLLENAGFLYDSSVGFNDAIGYKAGTSQVFKLPSSMNLFELPLSLMDTALFYKNRMGVNEPIAIKMVKKLIDQRKNLGGVLTINWHTRSLKPERNWDEFYLAILELLQSEKVWFTTASDAVKWFEVRRKIIFKEISGQDEKVHLSFQSLDYDDLPQFQLRIHIPAPGHQKKRVSINQKHTYRNITLARRSEVQVCLS